jgi:hypothetical protein
MKLAVSVFCFLLLFACQTTNGNSAVIEENKMIEVMAEVYILEMHYQKNYGAPVQYKKQLDRALKILFSSHGTTKASYEKSFGFYASKHEKFIQMNEAVIQRYNTLLLEK